MKHHHLVLVLACLAVLALAPALHAAGANAEAASPEKPAFESDCTITVDCECGNEPITCSGPTGTCTSGGSGCEEWIQCGSDPREYCQLPDPPDPCLSFPRCSSQEQCRLMCDPCPGASCTSQGCCICVCP